MDVPTILGAVASGLLIGGSVLGTVRWMLKNHTKELVNTMLEEALEKHMSTIKSEYLSELKPNHGSSLNDIVKLQVLPILKKLDTSQDAIKEDITEIKVEYARLEGRFDQYVEENK